MEKILVVDLAKCSGCRTCENVCSLKHDGVCNPSLARIGVVKWEFEGIYLPVICQHCEEPQCAKACPVGIITRHPETGAMVRDRDRCLGCKWYVPLGHPHSIYATGSPSLVICATAIRPVHSFVRRKR